MLKNDLREWEDVDIAAFYLACNLGLMKKGDFPVKAKFVFHSANKIGDALYKMLHDLEGLGILERHPTEHQFRWNFQFEGPWEEKVKCPVKIAKKCQATKKDCNHAISHKRTAFCNNIGNNNNKCKTCIPEGK